jgi:8-amino-7-oxononanoate synthase
MNPLRTIESAVGAQIVVAGRRYINFGGSSYLGLASNSEIVDAGVVALRESGSGYQFPRSHGIATGAHQEAEHEASEFFGSETALYLAGGYYFGLAAIGALRERFSTIFFDDWAHFSLRDAIAASGLKSYGFRHLDAADLEAKLNAHLHGNERPLIVTDGMYSTFGEIAPLDELARVMEPFGGHLVVDESHGFGTLGAHGRGAHEHHGIPPDRITIGGSTGKAFGVLGGIIPGSDREVAAFRKTPVGRGAATGLPAAASMCAGSFRYVRQHPELLRQLRANVSYLKARLRSLGLNVGDSIAPVATFVAGSDHSMQGLKERLMAEGIFVFHTTYIGAGAAGAIRCGIFTDHTPPQMDALVAALARLL